MLTMSSLTIPSVFLLLTCVAVSFGRHHERRGHPHHHHHANLHYDLQQEHSSSSVCYPGLGCFDSSYPFNNTGEIPQDPGFVNTVFRLYTRERSTDPDILVSGNRMSLIHASFNASNPVILLIHGFLATNNAGWIRNVTGELLIKGPTNVITVGWGGGAGFPYVQAAANTRLVGAQIANLITFLTHETGITQQRFHLIGHSLGAHVSGYTGHRVPGLGRITGLDPAQPCFQGQPPMVRLDPTDANFVDVIHTDGSPYETLGGFGMIEPVGHLDFYPNGGVQQPGCSHDGWSSFVSSAYNSGVEEAEFTVGCNHNRAALLFAESINSHCPFTAYLCSNYNDFISGNCFNCGNRPCPSMGYSAQGSASRGLFYLMTNGHRPFCGYHYLVEVRLSNNMHPVRGEINVRFHGNRAQTGIINLYRGILNPGDVLSKVFVSGSDVGDVEDVHVTFDRIYGYLDYLGFWNNDNDVQIQQLTSFTASSNIRKVFCPDEIIRSGRGIWLTRGMTGESISC